MKKIVRILLVCILVSFATGCFGPHGRIFIPGVPVPHGGSHGGHHDGGGYRH